MTDYAAFHEEVIKIAQDDAKKDKGWITKDRLKRLAIAAPVAAAGAGLGHGVGQLARKHMLSPAMQTKLRELASRQPLASKALGALPAVAGGLSAGAGILRAMKNRKIRDFVEGKDDKGTGPK